MKITLEKKDLATLLSKAMGYDIDVDEMEVHTDPFEVVIQNVRQAELADANPSQQAEVSAKPFTDIAPQMQEEDAQRAISGLKSINAQIASAGGGAGPVPVPMTEEPMYRDPNVLNPDESYDPDFGDK